MPAGLLPSRPAPHARRAALTALVLCSALLGETARAEGVLVGTVTRVHDGDSLTLQQQDRRIVVRLAAVDAPELDQPYGREAMLALRACAFGRRVVIQVHGPDRHGRTVGTLDSLGRDCGLAQVRAGLAWHYKAFEREQPVADRGSYAAAEREARRLRIGLWSQPRPTSPWDYRRQHPRSESIER